MRDPYDILGVSKGASEGDIKAPIAGLPKKLHPDANKHDPKAASRFAELDAAYEIVGDADKRKAFDRGEIDAEGKPRFRGFEGFGAQPRGGFNPGGGAHFESFSFGPDGFRRSGGGGGGGIDELLRGMFGGGARGGARQGSGTPFEGEDLSAGTGAGQDLHASLTITLNDAAKGTKPASICRPEKTSKSRFRRDCERSADPAERARLAECKRPGRRCPDHGQRGSAFPVQPDGSDLRLELPITLYEAALGGKVRVPTLDGAVELAIPAGTNSGRTFRLKGKGLKAKGGSGDLLATVRIMLPEQADDTFTEMMKSWRDKKPYDPRGGME